MDGNVAPMDKIYELANKYDAMVMIDESHSAVWLGKRDGGYRTFDLMGKFEIITARWGKLAVQSAVLLPKAGNNRYAVNVHARIFSNLFADDCRAGIKMFEMMDETNELQDKLHANTDYFVGKM